MVDRIKLYLITFAAFLAIDMLWLGVLAGGMYNRYLGHLMADEVNWIAAILFYLLFILGLLILVVLPGLSGGSLKNTLLRALLFGLVTYGTYDLTNLATLQDWPLWMTIVDMLWGSLLSVAVSWISFQAGRRLRLT